MTTEHLSLSLYSRRRKWVELRGSAWPATVLHYNKQAKCSIPNVPCIMCYHMLRTTAAFFFNCQSAVLLKPAEEISAQASVLRLINTHIWMANRRPLDWTPVGLWDHQLLHIATEIVFILSNWTLTPQLIVR